MSISSTNTKFFGGGGPILIYIYIGVGTRDLYIDEAHMALDIFRFAVFFLFMLERFLKLSFTKMS